MVSSPVTCQLSKTNPTNFIILIALSCVCKQRIMSHFLSQREKLILVTEKASRFENFLFLHVSSIFSGLGVKICLSLSLLDAGWQNM